MDLREKITTLLSVYYPGHPFSVMTHPDRVGIRAWVEYHNLDLNFGEDVGHGETADEALGRLWERVQKGARFRIREEESALRTFERTMDSAARNARVTTDRLASLRMAMRNTGANPRDPGLLHAAPSPPSAPTRLKIAAVWGWCHDRTGTVQTEETVRYGKPWRHAWVDHDGHLATRGYGATDDEALANLWQRVQQEADMARAAREDRLAMCRQRILDAQSTERDIIASLAQIDRIMAEEGGS